MSRFREAGTTFWPKPNLRNLVAKREKQMEGGKGWVQKRKEKGEEKETCWSKKKYKGCEAYPKPLLNVTWNLNKMQTGFSTLIVLFTTPLSLINYQYLKFFKQGQFFSSFGTNWG